MVQSHQLYNDRINYKLLYFSCFSIHKLAFISYLNALDILDLRVSFDSKANLCYNYFIDIIDVNGIDLHNDTIIIIIIFMNA